MKRKIIGYAILLAFPAAIYVASTAGGLGTRDACLLAMFGAIPLGLVVVTQAIQLILD